ncbi:carbohydrate-binding protein [Streptomyces sp. NBC_01477]|uniref:carbohydrate-binding protein n=1 Tax=Streptomyces sp. NBC_01477 TaxID=2976015 RepID=UPI002E344D68|nr:carbohydrate-binding protein [Streptomyces sp. NBC_01477]
MTAGHDGTPENDDPFGYLYRAEDGTEQPAAPRNTHNQVQRVGERRSPQQGGYGYPQPQQQPPPQQQPYGYEQGQGGQGQGQAPYGGQPQYTRQQPQHAPAQPGDGGGRRGAGPGRGGGDTSNRKGLLIGAIAVVAAVAIGIAFAMTNSSGKDKDTDSKPTSAPVSSAPPSTQGTPSVTTSPFSSDKVDASTFALAGGAALSTEWPGANAAGGKYVDHLGQAGAGATWTVTVPEDGDYTFFVSYGNAGPDATLSLAVNGKLRTTPVKLKNYGSYTDWSKAWNNTTYAWVSLKQGDNTLQLSFQQGDTGAVNLDQTWLKQGQVKK